jgi:hypothetical protein
MGDEEKLASAPAFIKAAYKLKPIAGFIFTPALVT